MNLRMNIQITTLMCVFGCERPISAWTALSFPSTVLPDNDTGDQPPSEPPQRSFKWIASPTMDDGFGSSVVFGDDKIWIGAPYGNLGHVYQWKDEELSTVLSGNGKLGSHLAWSNEGLWISSPLHEDGAGSILLADGTHRPSTRPGTGIALTSSGTGAFAWTGGWMAADGTSGAAEGRPTSLHMNQNGIMGIGMARGPHYVAFNSTQLARIVAGDEAGFSIASADIDNDEDEEWIIGAPGSGQVFALDGTSLEITKQWTGTGRFGHALSVCKAEEQNGSYLLVGAPLHDENGAVFVFKNFENEPSAVWKGLDSGAELGTHITCQPGGFLAGAPGNAELKGKVLAVQGFLPTSP